MKIKKVTKIKLEKKISVYDIQCKKNNNFQIESGVFSHNSLVQCRDPKIHAIMPLKGKVMNICGSKKEYFKNVELVELINAIGCGVEEDCKPELINYDKVIITADADADGCPAIDEQIYIKKDNYIDIISFKDLINQKEKYEKTYKTIVYDKKNKRYLWSIIEKIWPKKKFNKWIKIILENDEEFEVTEDHIIFTEKGEIKAKDLTYEDNIIGISKIEKKNRGII